MAAPMNVLLGIQDEALNANNSSFLTNKIGGTPDWIYAGHQTNPLCKLCGNHLYLVIQLYCPLEGSKYHRTLYIFACTNQPCWNQNDSWHILRSQKLAVPMKAEKKVEKSVMTTNDWCQEADDWGEDDDTSCTDMLGLKLPAAISSEEDHTLEQWSAVEGHGNTDEFATKLLNLRLCEQAVLPTPVEFQSFYINVFEEPTEQSHVTEHERMLLKDYEQREGLDLMEWCDDSNDKGKKSSKNEKYEKAIATHGDLVFEKFLKRTALCSQQCLRYCWSGSPLYIRKPLHTPQEPCTYCGSKMTFELQLMPALVGLIRGKSDTGIEKSVEFGVVLVYTCSESCWNDEDTINQDEVVIVQSDPDQDLFKMKVFE